MNIRFVALICALTLHSLYAAEAEIKIALLKDFKDLTEKEDLIKKAAQLWWDGQGDNQKHFSHEQTKAMADYLRQHAHDQTKKYCWIALHENEVVGITQLVDIWTKDPQVAPNIAAHIHEWTPWIRCLVVAPAYRKQGISKQLLQAAEQKARELNHEFVYLGCEEFSDRGLVTMYCKNGYAAFASDTFRGAPTILMRKALKVSDQ